jgi:hypothetical protein
LSAVTTSPSRRPDFSAGDPLCTTAITAPSSVFTPSFFAISCVEIGHFYTQTAAPYFAVTDDLAHHRARHAGRYSEADADVAAGRTDDGGVDTDQLAAQIHQRAAGIAGIDRGIGSE